MTTAKHGLTVFQQLAAEQLAWESGPREGPPKLYTLFLDHGIGVWVDPYPKVPDSVVVAALREGMPGVAAHLSDLTPERTVQFNLVVRAVGRRMLSVCEYPDFPGAVRVLQHVEGYGVPEDPHTVLIPALRGEGVALYEPPRFTADPGRLRHTQEMFALPDDECTALKIELSKHDTLAFGNEDVGHLGTQ